MNKPKVSVVMSVYNGEKYLRESINSVLNQTFKDYKFIIINDGSTDQTQEILDSYNDSRIVVLNQHNTGLTKSLNRGLKIAKGEYIARMDAGDICSLDRLEREESFLAQHNKVGLVGTSNYEINDRDIVISTNNRLATNEQIQEKLLAGNCFGHGSTMFRRECIEKVGYYREEFRNTQDYDLWLRIAEKYEVANIPEPLYQWRLDPKSITVTKFQNQRDFTELARILARERRLYGKDRLQIPEKRQEIIEHINAFKRKNATRKARSENYLCWAGHFWVYDTKNFLNLLIKSFIANPFYCVGSLFAVVIGKVLRKIRTG